MRDDSSQRYDKRHGDRPAHRLYVPLGEIAEANFVQHHARDVSGDEIADRAINFVLTLALIRANASAAIVGHDGHERSRK